MHVAGADAGADAGAFKVFYNDLNAKKIYIKPIFVMNSRGIIPQ